MITLLAWPQPGPPTAADSLADALLEFEHRAQTHSQHGRTADPQQIATRWADLFVANVFSKLSGNHEHDRFSQILLTV